MFTKVYKVVDGLELSIDVHIPSSFSGNTGVVLLHFHGGYLIFGEKTTFPPHWLINACNRRGWAYATPSYRLMPETPATEIVRDAVDAALWVRENVAPKGKLIVAGSSAGGYLALATVAHPQAPPIAAFLSVYGMLDPTLPRYLRPGQPMGTPVVGLSNVLDEIHTAKGQIPTDGYPFPANPETDKRFIWMKAMHEAAIYPDIMTNVPGLSRQIEAHGTAIIPEPFHVLFPATFGLRPEWPPTILIHGDSDPSVALDHSRNLSKALQNLGVDAQLEVVEGQGHGFDVRGIPAGVDVDNEKGQAFYYKLANCIGFLEQKVQHS